MKNFKLALLSTAIILSLAGCQGQVNDTKIAHGSNKKSTLQGQYQSDKLVTQQLDTLIK
jgi:hypothetical protein